MFNLYIFDLDETLANRSESILRPEAARWFRRHKPKRVAICTNQGGVGLRYWMESSGFGEPEKFPTEAAVRTRVAAIKEQVRSLTGGIVDTYISFSYQTRQKYDEDRHPLPRRWAPVPESQEGNPEWSRDWRKPGPGMLLQAAEDFDVSPSECIFIGDCIGYNESDAPDMLAAKAAKIPFEWESEFFATAVKLYYPADWPFAWLKPHERIGLDMPASRAEFDQLLTNWFNSISGVHGAYVTSSRRQRVFRLEAEYDFPMDFLMSYLQDKDINRDWIRYESAEAHAEALASNIEVGGLALIGSLMNHYGINHDEARLLVEAYR